jgi:23S rRNA (uracil1939-C5)-methyltransferase
MVELHIETLGARGDGIAHDGDGTVYVPLTVPGDHVTATVTQTRGEARHARLDQVLQPGPDRVAPPCPHFGVCGGCAMQHLGDDAYKRWKLDILHQALAQRGLADVAIGEMISVPPAGRRRARFAARRLRGGVHLGFNALGSHNIIDLSICHILVPSIVAILDDLRVLLAELLPPGGKADVQITETETGLDIWLVANIPHNAQNDMRLAEFAQTADLARLSTGTRPDIVMVRRAPRITFNGVAVTPPPDGFLQASLAGERALAGLIRGGVGDAGRVADLYAGVGTFSFAMDARVEVLAAEGAEAQVQALTDARNKARRTRIDVQMRDLERRPLSNEELQAFDAVIFDPPRSGARGQTELLATSGVPVLLAVSCNPSTFARDARTLVDGGYHLASVTPLDQFPWSRHLELVAKFQR